MYVHELNCSVAELLHWKFLSWAENSPWPIYFQSYKKKNGGSEGLENCRLSFVTEGRSYLEN